MNLAIVGNRFINDEEYNDFEFVEQETNRIINEHNLEVTHILSGGAKGADNLARVYAVAYGIPTVLFRPQYEIYGKKATFLRNTIIVEESDFVIAFWDGNSNGTRDTIHKAYALNKPIEIVKIGDSI